MSIETENELSHPVPVDGSTYGSSLKVTDSNPNWSTTNFNSCTQESSKYKRSESPILNKEAIPQHYV